MARKSSWKPVLFVAMILGPTLILSFIALLKYTATFSGPISPQHESWAEFGDFISGSVGASINIGALIGLVVLVLLSLQQIAVSKSELQETRDQLVTQRYDNLLMGLITTYLDLRENAQFTEHRGSAAIHAGMNRIAQAFSNPNGEEVDYAEIETMFNDVFENHRYRFLHPLFGMLAAMTRVIRRAPEEKQDDLIYLLAGILDRNEISLLACGITRQNDAYLEPTVSRFASWHQGGELGDAHAFEHHVHEYMMDRIFPI